MTESPKPSLTEGFCLIVEDQAETTEFLRNAVAQAFPKLNIVTFAEVKEARVWLQRRDRKPSLALALVDLGLPDGSGLDVLRLIKEHEPEARAVVITIYDSDATLFDALSAGASGYILKGEEPFFLVEILKRIENGEPPLSPSIARRLLNHFAGTKTEKPSEAELTSREKETLTLLARGMTVPESAQQMGLSASTVAGYVKIIYQKLHVSNRAEATREAIRRGLV